MVLRIAGKNVDIGQALRTRIEETVAAAVRKYFDGGTSGHVTVSKSGRIFETELVLHLDTGIVLEAQGSDADAASQLRSVDGTAGQAAQALQATPERTLTPPAARRPIKVLQWISAIS